jgi:hypothetical protein
MLLERVPYPRPADLLLRLRKEPQGAVLVASHGDPLLPPLAEGRRHDDQQLRTGAHPLLESLRRVPDALGQGAEGDSFQAARRDERNGVVGEHVAALR